MIIMRHSIQEIAKKINSRLTIYDNMSLGVAALLLTVLAIWMTISVEKANVPISYMEAEGSVLGDSTDHRPFASMHGPTYTFSWCQGADVILQKNRIYFKDAEEAEKSGRTLSKLCQR